MGITKLPNNKPPKRHECGIHDLTYTAVRPGCPLCASEREIKQLRNSLKELNAKLQITHDQNVRLEAETNFTFAIKEASSVLNDEDLAFFKTVLYQWRDQKSLGLKVTHGKSGANGFIVIPRHGNPWAHSCTSMGGLAIADYFDEATNAVGSAKAMEHLVRGMAAHLPGAVT